MYVTCVWIPTANKWEANNTYRFWGVAHENENPKNKTNLIQQIHWIWIHWILWKGSFGILISCLNNANGMNMYTKILAPNQAYKEW